MVSNLFVYPLPPRAWGAVHIAGGMVQGAPHVDLVYEAIANRVKSSIGSERCGAALLGLGTGKECPKRVTDGGAPTGTALSTTGADFGGAENVTSGAIGDGL
jgi:hypothetical protein